MPRDDYKIPYDLLSDLAPPYPRIDAAGECSFCGLDESTPKRFSDPNSHDGWCSWAQVRKLMVQQDLEADEDEIESDEEAAQREADENEAQRVYEAKMTALAEKHADLLLRWCEQSSGRTILLAQAIEPAKSLKDYTGAVIIGWPTVVAQIAQQVGHPAASMWLREYEDAS